jgi:hypothetical protein
MINDRDNDDDVDDGYAGPVFWKFLERGELLRSFEQSHKCIGTLYNSETIGNVPHRCLYMWLMQRISLLQIVCAV